MNGRRLVLVSLVAALLSRDAQAASGPDVSAAPTGRVPRIGILGYAVEPALIELLRQSLKDLGRVEGRDYVLEQRATEARIDELPGRAAELLRLEVDVILAVGTPSVRAAQQATGTVPIVMVGIGLDPVQLGIVQSLARPGGNVTGVAALGAELWGKRLQLFRTAVPKASHVSFLSNPSNPGNLLASKEFGIVATAAGLRTHFVTAKDLGELDRALAEIAREAPDALVCAWDAFFQLHARRIFDFALQRRLPTLSAIREFVEGGALMSYGTDLPSQWKHAARYLDRILGGTKPADLPVEQPLRFELVINRKTAKVLGLTIPPELMLLADRVIE